MTDRKVPQHEDYTESDLTGLEIQTVSGHAQERYENLRSVLCMLYPLRQGGIVPAAGSTTISGAEWQKEKGTAADDTQAAHTMPRRLLINGRSLADWVKATKDPDLQFAIKSIEGTVTTLPSYVNRADTKWENKGLCAAYAAAAHEVLHVAPRDSTQAEAHFEGVWQRFHHNAGDALFRARMDAAGDIASVLGTYQIVHGSALSRSAEKHVLRYHWNNLLAK